jgi:hypothetical protein
MSQWESESMLPAIYSENQESSMKQNQDPMQSATKNVKKVPISRCFLAVFAG